MSEILLNKEFYRNNLSIISDLAGGAHRIYLVGKDNFYGHGDELCQVMASEFGIKKLALRDTKEARRIFAKFDEILILSEREDFDPKFSYAINSIDQLKQMPSHSKIHVNVDTLMHRNGIDITEISSTIEISKKLDLNILGFFTHFRSADEIGAEFFIQKKTFNDLKGFIISECDKFGYKNLIFHTYNSSALIRGEKIASDECVRVGLIQFGYGDVVGLKRVLSLYADKISSRILKKGSKIGYGGMYKTPCDMRVATYDLGYGDGLFRYNGIGDLRLGNNELMLGRMSMDSFSSKDCGDRICVMDNADIWAKFFNTINYEILVKLSNQIQRRIYE